MDPELIAYLDKRFEEVNERLGRLEGRADGAETRLDGVDQRFGQMDVTVRGIGVQIESLRGQIQQVAKGVAGFNQTLVAFQADFSRQFAELREVVQTSHSNLHRRVGSLEAWREKIDPPPPAARKRRT